MRDLPSLLGAVAATAAAVLAAANLYLSGRREHTRWKREALIEAFQAFLGTSFEWSDTARAAYELRGRSSGHAQVPEALREVVTAAHARQVEALTRLRLLADARVISAAESLHECDHGVSRLAFDVDKLAPEKAWDDARRLTRAAQEDFIDASRRSIHLSRGAAIRNPL